MNRAIFLSASIPNPERDERFFATMDVIAIRDAARALATVVLPHATLYWGGHPSITPLIRAVAESMKFTKADRLRLFQSAWFSEVLPADNAVFESYELTPRRESREASMAVMRERMVTAAHFNDAIFLGGMEGVELEFDLFRRYHPTARVHPIASTGAAARLLYERERNHLGLPATLNDDYAYPSLFRSLLHLPDDRSVEPEEKT